MENASEAKAAHLFWNLLDRSDLSADELGQYSMPGPIVTELIGDVEIQRQFSPGSEGWMGLVGYVKGEILGHSNITECVISNFLDSNLKSTYGMQYLVRSSQDPDRAFFDKLEYHAQSSSKDSSQDDRALFESRIKDWSARIRRNPRDIGSIQALGFLLHSIQDLVVHRGMTNAEHSHLDSVGQSPDVVNVTDHAFESAVYLCTEALCILFDSKKQAMEAMISMSCGLDYLPRLENTGVKPIEWMRSILQYKALSESHDANGPEHGIRWYELPVDPNEIDCSLLIANLEPLLSDES